MNYNCFLIKTQDYEKYPEISELFPGDPESDDIIIGADNGEDSIILALMIGSISITDRSAACVSYVWRRRQDTDEEIFRDMLEAFRKELKSRNITKLRFRVINVEDITYSLLNGKMLEDIGCIKAEEHGSSMGYYLADFYDTAFMRSQVIKASQDEHLVSFALCTKEECSRYLKELQKDKQDTDFSFMSYMPFSYFYFEKGKPVGALAIEHYGRGSCLLDGVVIKKGKTEGKIFRALLAGVLSGALDGEAMQMRLYMRLDNTKYLHIVEESLGEWSFTPEISDYIYTVS